jgi:hypothetical protein
MYLVKIWAKAPAAEGGRERLHPSSPQAAMSFRSGAEDSTTTLTAGQVLLLVLVLVLLVLALALLLLLVLVLVLVLLAGVGMAQELRDLGAPAAAAPRSWANKGSAAHAVARSTRQPAHESKQCNPWALSQCAQCLGGRQALALRRFKEEAVLAHVVHRPPTVHIATSMLCPAEFLGYSMEGGVAIVTPRFILMHS